MARRTLRPEVVRQKLVESHAVGGFHRQLALQRFPASRRIRPAAAHSAGTGRGNTLCGRATCAAPVRRNDSPVVRSSSSGRADGVSCGSSILACCTRAQRRTAAARRRGPATRRSRASNRSAPRPCARLYGAAIAIEFQARLAAAMRNQRVIGVELLPLGSIDRTARRFTTHSAANASRKRSLF